MQIKLGWYGQACCPFLTESISKKEMNSGLFYDYREKSDVLSSRQDERTLHLHKAFLKRSRPFLSFPVPLNLTLQWQVRGIILQNHNFNNFFMTPFLKVSFVRATGKNGYRVTYAYFFGKLVCSKYQTWWRFSGF